MKIDILCVGKIKEKFFQDAISEYSKRLSAYAKLEIIEVKDEGTKADASIKEEELVLKAEAERLQKYISDKAFVIALCVEGKQTDSVSFSKVLEKAEVEGKGHLQFIIGGSLGLLPEIKKRANLRLSFSEMTFPHQLMRVILCEQIYRGYRIKNNEPYHK